MMKTEELRLVTEWDKTFQKSEKIDHSKVTFVNRYGITLAADMYVPKEAEGKLPAIAVCGPFGAVKEQCSGLYHILAKNTPASSSGRDEFALNGCSHSKIHARSIFQ